jgi:RNA polymerase sigma-70 factor (ECF subfamily)
VDGCTPDEVAAELSLSRWAVYKARSRVLQRLRTELEGLENLDNSR